MTRTTQEGENGLRNVTMRNVYDTNGTLLEQTILSTETIKEPVNKKVVWAPRKLPPAVPSTLRQRQVPLACPQL